MGVYDALFVVTLYPFTQCVLCKITPFGCISLPQENGYHKRINIRRMIIKPINEYHIHAVKQILILVFLPYAIIQKCVQRIIWRILHTDILSGFVCSVCGK